MNNDYKRVMDLCIEVSGISEEKIRSKCRKREVVTIRSVFCKIMYDTLNCKLKHIGYELSCKDKPRHHTSIRDAVIKGRGLINDKVYNADTWYEAVIEKMQGWPAYSKLTIHCPPNYNMHRLINHLNKLKDDTIKYEIT